MRRELTKAARNERRKLRSTTFNAVGLAALGLGFFARFVALSSTFDVISVASIAIFFLCHWIAQRYVEQMED